MCLNCCKQFRIVCAGTLAVRGSLGGIESFHIHCSTQNMQDPKHHFDQEIVKVSLDKTIKVIIKHNKFTGDQS